MVPVQWQGAARYWLMPALVVAWLGTDGLARMFAFSGFSSGNQRLMATLLEILADSSKMELSRRGPLRRARIKKGSASLADQAQSFPTLNL